MQWLARVCVKRPVFAVMLIAAMVVAGVVSYGQLGVARFPSIDLPSLFIRTSFPGSSPEEMESEVSQPVEDAVASVEGIDELRSISGEGFSFVILTLELDRDVDDAAQEARDAVGRAMENLPAGTDPPEVGKRDVDSSPVVSIVVSGARDSRELYALADRHVKDVIESVQGVGEIEIHGAMDRAVQVAIDAQRLAAYGLSILDVRQALIRQNAAIPGGLMQTQSRELTIRTLGRVDQAREFSDLVVATVDEVPVRLRDLGQVTDSQKEIRTFARLNNQPAVVVSVRSQPGTNTVAVIQDIKHRLVRSRTLLPDDVHMDIIQDQSGYILAAMHEVQKHLISGSILASLVVLIFMRSWRSSLIAAVAIPASIIATFAAMRALNFTLNNVTLLALVLMVGVVIDDAIIVLENVFHHVEEYEVPPMRAAVEGTKEIGLAVLATTLSLVVVFLPVSFLASVTGRLLYQFGLTASVAILVSMFVSFSLTPMMCSRLLRSPARDRTHKSSREGFYRWIDRGYSASLAWALRHRLLVLLVSAAVIAANVPLYHLVQQDYIPTNVDESEFEVRVEAPQGSSIASTDQAMRAIEAELENVTGIAHILTTVGTRSRVNTGEVFIRLKDVQQRTFSLGRLLQSTLKGQPLAAFQGNFSQRDKMQQVREILKKFPELDASVRNLTSFRQGAPVDIDFSITGPTLEGLHHCGTQLLEKVSQLPGIVDAQLTLKMDKPELRVHVDRERAAAVGVDVREIAETLRIAVGGEEHVSRYHDRSMDDVYDVDLRLVGIDRREPSDISQLYIRTSQSNNSDGKPTYVRLDNVVNFELGQTASRIDRLDRQRMIALRANIDTGYALSDRISAIQQAADQLSLPDTYATSIRGGGRELERTLTEFRWTLLLSFVFMYIVLAAQFEHFVHPLTILVSLPLAVPFGLFSLWLGGQSLNLYSALGILVLFGVVKKASILQVDHTNQLRQQGLDRTAAIMQANRDRLRPILMTTLSFVAGMFPLLVGTGPGAEERRSIAILAVGGQTLSLLLTLLAVPVVYSFFDDVGRLLRRPSPLPDGAEHQTVEPTTTTPQTPQPSRRPATPVR